MNSHLTAEERYQDQLDDVKRELARINNDAVTLHEQDARISVRDGNRISWPYPMRNMEMLALALREIPTDADVAKINELMSMFSLGWNFGRNQFIEEYDIPMQYGRPHLDNSLAQSSSAQSEQPTVDR